MVVSPGVPRWHNANWSEQFVMQRKRCTRQKPNRPPSVLLGDSIAHRFKSSILPPNFLNLGIGGDKVNNVLYRIQNNGIPKVVQDVVIILGTNNLSSGHSPFAIAHSLKQLADVLANQCQVLGKIFISQLLPRKDKLNVLIPLVNSELL